MRDKQRSIGGEPIKCIWMTAGVVDYKLCEYEFECEYCPFDRAIRGVFPDRPVGVQERIQEPGYKFDEGLFYHPAHVWIRVEEGGKVRIGLDDFGQWLSGRVYSIRLPAPGTRVDRDEGCWGITHGFGETLLSGGVRGEVVLRNRKLEMLPSLVNSDPYGDGWAFVLEPENLPESLKSLNYGEEARIWFAQEMQRLRLMLEQGTPELGITLQDGGLLKSDATSAVSEAMIDLFLAARGTKSGSAETSSKF